MVASVELRQLAADMNRLEQQFKDLSTPQLGHSAIMGGGAIGDYDANAVLRGMIGEQFDGTHGVVMVNGPVPPVPSDPVVQAAVGGFIVRWDGFFRNADGVPDITVIAPEDWTRNEVHVGPAEGFSPDFADTLEGTMESPRGPSVFVAADPGTYWIKMYSRSSSGKRSAATPAVSVTVEALNAGLPAEIDAAEVRIINAGSLLLDELTTLSGKLSDQDTAISDAETGAVATAAVDATNKAAAAQSAAEQTAATDATNKAAAAQSAAIDAAATDAASKAAAAKSEAITAAAADAQTKATNAAAAAETAAKTHADLVAGGAQQAAIDAAATDAASKAAAAQQAAIDAAATDAASKAAAAEAAAISAAATDAANKAAAAKSEAIAAAATDATNKANAAQAAGVAAAGTKNTVYYSTLDATGTAEKAGDTWRKVDGAGNIIAEWRWSTNNAWAPQKVTSDAISNLDVGKLSVGSANMAEAVIDKLFADVTVARMSVAEAFIGENAILTGAITAPKITASEEMWAKVLGAHRVTADEADLGTFTANEGFVADLEAEIMTADVFNGREFTGGTFTGATFRTDAGATVGVKLDAAGFRVYKANAAVFNATAAGDVVMTGVVNTSGSVSNQFYTGFIDAKFGMFTTLDPQPGSTPQDVVGMSFNSRTTPQAWPAGLHSPDGEQIVLTSATAATGDARAMLSMASWGMELYSTAGQNFWSLNGGIDLHGLQGVWIDGGDDAIRMYTRTSGTAGVNIHGTTLELLGGTKMEMHGPHPGYSVNFIQSSDPIEFTLTDSTSFQSITALDVTAARHLTIARAGAVLRFLEEYSASSARVYVQAPSDIAFTGNSAPTSLRRLLAASVYNEYGGTYLRGEGETTVNGNSTGATWGARIYDARFAQSFGIRSDSSCYVQSPPIYARTTTAAANVNVSTAGTLFRSTSSTKYKVAIQNFDVDETAEDALLGLEIKTWFDRLEAEAVAELQTEIVEAKRGVKKGRPERKPNDNAHIPDVLRRIPGLLAEDVKKILPAFVEHGPEGETEAIMYERLAMLWIPVVRRLKARNVSLENQIKAIESRLTKAGIK